MEKSLLQMNASGDDRDLLTDHDYSELLIKMGATTKSCLVNVRLRKKESTIC